MGGVVMDDTQYPKVSELWGQWVLSDDGTHKVVPLDARVIESGVKAVVIVADQDGLSVNGRPVRPDSAFALMVSEVLEWAEGETQ